jgi:hypothetical protein
MSLHPSRTTQLLCLSELPSGALGLPEPMAL